MEKKKLVKLEEAITERYEVLSLSKDQYNLLLWLYDNEWLTINTTLYIDKETM